MRKNNDGFWSALTWTERAACLVGAALGETAPGRVVATQYQSRVSVPLLGLTIDNRLHLDGFEHVPLDGSFIFAANHRSYFDLYAIMLAIWDRFAEPPHLYCPVRTNFFYDKPAGIALNLAMCANAMYPPVFRDERGRTLNRHAVDRAVRLLHRSPRTIVAMHPEGRRSEGDDPYVLMAPKSGVGRIALAARRPVVPVFVNGLPPSFGALVRDRLSPHGTPVRVFIGAPVELADLYASAEDPEAHREAARRTMDAIALAGERDRAFMGLRVAA
jgi:1-acyl-sn-glycerol-3-phosphate acyltransferase